MLKHESLGLIFSTPHPMPLPFEAADLITGSALRAARRLRKGSGGRRCGLFLGWPFFGGARCCWRNPHLAWRIHHVVTTRFFQRFFFFRLFCVEQIIGPLLRYYFSFKRFWVISTNLGDFRWLYVSFNKNLETTHHHLSLSPHFSSVPKINTSLPCRKRTWHKALKIGRILIGKDRDSNYPYLFSRLEKGVGRSSSFWNPWFGREGYDKPTMSSSLRWSVPPLGFGTRGHGGFHLL